MGLRHFGQLSWSCLSTWRAKTFAPTVSTFSCYAAALHSLEVSLILPQTGMVTDMVIASRARAATANNQKRDAQYYKFSQKARKAQHFVVFLLKHTIRMPICSFYATRRQHRIICLKHTKKFVESPTVFNMKSVKSLKFIFQILLAFMNIKRVSYTHVSDQV